MSPHRLAGALALIAVTVSTAPARAQDPPVGGFGPARPARRPAARPLPSLPAQPEAPTATPARRRASEPARTRPAAEPAADPARRAVAEGAGGSSDPGTPPAAPTRAAPAPVPEERVGTGPDVTDPFAAPKGKKGPPRVDPQKHRPWFIRPALEAVIRLSPDRSFLPQEGFGFSLVAGGVIGRGSTRFGLALGYSYHRVARDLSLPNTDIGGSPCEGTRDVTYHLATGSILGQLHFEKASVWVGARGGFAFGKVGSAVYNGSLCSAEDADAPTGVLGPVIGLGYALRPDLLIGLNASYLHFFSKKVFEYDSATSTTPLTHPIFYDLVTIGLAITLTF